MAFRWMGPRTAAVTGWPMTAGGQQQPGARIGAAGTGGNQPIPAVAGLAGGPVGIPGQGDRRPGGRPGDHLSRGPRASTAWAKQAVRTVRMGIRPVVIRPAQDVSRDHITYIHV